VRYRVTVLVVDAALGLARAWRSTALAGASIVSAVFVLGAFLMASRAVDEALDAWARAPGLSVYLADTATPDERDAVRRALEGSPVVAGVEYVDRGSAAGRFARSFPDLAPLLQAAGEEPLPASFEVVVRAEAGAGAEVDALVTRVGAMPGVADVRLDRALLARVAEVVRAARWAGAGLAGVLALAAALSVVSVVRLSYIARQDEVAILYLVGAPLWAIRGPFVLEGLLQGVAGSAVALAALAAAHRWIVARFGAAVAAALGLDALPFLAPTSIAACIAVSGLLGAAAGLAAVRERPPADLE
jgi:cell division transport system permease protein